MVGDRVLTYDRSHGLPSDAVRGLSIQRDVDGVDLLWLATEGGIARAALGSSQWQTVSLLGARENGIFGLLLEADERGETRAWVGSAKAGLAMLEAGQWRYFRVGDGSLPGEGTRMIWRVRRDDGQFVRQISVPRMGVFDMDDRYRFTPMRVPWDGAAITTNFALSRQVGDGWERWYANASIGLWRLHKAQWRQFMPEGIQQPWSVTHLTEQIDSSGRSWLWAASNQGVARFDGEQWTMLPHALSRTDDGYRSTAVVNESGRAVLWAATVRHGVIRLDVSDPSKPIALPANEIPAPPDPSMYSVLADPAGRIYLCTNNGVQQLTPNVGGGYSSRVFRRRDGLVHDECNTNGQAIDASGRYWVGTLGGLSVFDPTILTPTATAQAKPLMITSVRVDGTPRTRIAEQALSLSSSVRELRIDYALLAGIRESESLYRSQLLGLDPGFTDWVTDHSRSFSRLAPGEYTLKVEARDYRGTPSAPLALRIQIKPEWWQSGLFQLLIAFGLGLLAVATVLLYNRTLRTRKHALELEVAARTRELDAANQRLTELSYRDPLTGIANRRRLMEAMAAGIVRARDRQCPIGLIVIDVDHFKAYNDQFGHLAGDAALRAIAKAIESAMRSQDLVARYGGEEFACLMLDASADVVEGAAERMRALVEALPPRVLGNDVHGVTLSAGTLSRVPQPGEVGTDLLRDADAALYRAKGTGRNRVCHAE